MRVENSFVKTTRVRFWNCFSSKMNCILISKRIEKLLIMGSTLFLYQKKKRKITHSLFVTDVSKYLIGFLD